MPYEPFLLGVGVVFNLLNRSDSIAVSLDMGPLSTCEAFSFSYCGHAVPDTLERCASQISKVTVRDLGPRQK